jgi:hypothetical protein
MPKRQNDSSDDIPNNYQERHEASRKRAQIKIDVIKEQIDKIDERIHEEGNLKYSILAPESEKRRQKAIVRQLESHKQALEDMIRKIQMNIYGSGTAKKVPKQLKPWMTVVNAVKKDKKYAHLTYSEQLKVASKIYQKK